MAVARPSSGRMTKPQGEWAVLGVFFPIDIALYSIAFGTYKTAELIDMPFGTMTRVGPRYHVLHEGSDPRREGGSLGENVAALCKVMGHSTVS